MKIELWLQRLSLEKHLEEFTKKDIHFVSDLLQFNNEFLTGIPIEPTSLKNRFLGAIRNKKEYKEYFKDIEKDAARKIIENYT